MPMYAYTVKDANGRTKKDIVEALNEQSLIERLQNEGLFVINVTATAKQAQVVAKKKAAAGRKFSHNKTKLEDLLILARQLATLLESGVTLMRSLAVVLDQIESKQLHGIITQIKVDVEQGKTFSSSLAKYPKVFNQFWVSLVEVGEASGTMPVVLERLTEYSEQEAEFRSTVTSAMIYPAVLFVVCMGAVVFFALFVAPRFESIFSSMKVELPGITVTMLAVFKFVKTQFVMLVLGAFGFVIVIKQYLKTKPGQMLFEKIMYNLPTFGEVYKLIVVEKFTSQMAILVESGVPILYALEISERLVENISCALVIAEIRESVREGKLLADPMMASGFFPSMAVQMIKVGEETGQLGKMLNHVSVFYKRNVKEFMKRFGTLIEPVMLVFMGALIGTIVLAMFLPLFDLTGG